MLPVNFMAVLLAAVAAFVIGFLIHGPIAGKLYLRLTGGKAGTKSFVQMAPQMLLNFIANLLTAYVLSVVYLFAVSSPYMGGYGALNGMACAFWVWLGFIVTSSSMDFIWHDKKKSVWVFELVASLIVFLSMGAIIAVM